MSAMGALFQPGGLTYRTVPDAIDLLPKGVQQAATVAQKAVMRRLAEGKLDETATDRALAEESGWSPSLIQKGLHAMEVLARQMGLAPLVKRVRAHGRRTIIPSPLAGRGTRLETPPAPPPSDRRDTSTEPDRSTSSPFPHFGGEPAPEAPPELVGRACDLIPEATPTWVAAMVRDFPADWFSRALDQVEARNRKPGNKPVAKRRYVEVTLEGYRSKGGPPKQVAPTPAPAPARVPTGPSLRAVVEAPREPFTAEEVAVFVEQWRRGPVASLKTIARTNLRAAVEGGRVAPELVATIPPEMLARE